MELINWFSLNLMKANPDKFQAIAIGKKTKSQTLSFNLNGNKIVCEDNVKLLGVTQAVPCGPYSRHSCGIFLT
jgi:hypothetical protein